MNFNKNNENLEIFGLHVTGYFNTEQSFPIFMFLKKPWENDIFICMSLSYKNSNLHILEIIKYLFA